MEDGPEFNRQLVFMKSTINRELRTITRLRNSAIRTPIAVAESLSELCPPQVIAEVDDMDVKVAKVRGETTEQTKSIAGQLRWLHGLTSP